MLGCLTRQTALLGLSQRKKRKSRDNINQGFPKGGFIRGQKVGYGTVVDGIAKFQALKFTFQSLKFPPKSLVLLVRRRSPQKFQALKFQNSGPEIWRIHPPLFHTPPVACLVFVGGGGNLNNWGGARASRNNEFCVKSL